MFQLRKETNYAIQFLQALAKHEHRPLSLNDVALSTQISFLFLQKIARKLRLSGLIKSAHGKNGGYQLAISVKKITFKKIIEVMEGRRGIIICVEHNGAKSFSGCAICRLKQKVAKTNERLLQILHKVKLNNL